MMMAAAKQTSNKNNNNSSNSSSNNNKQQIKHLKLTSRPFKWRSSCSCIGSCSSCSCNWTNINLRKSIKLTHSGLHQQQPHVRLRWQMLLLLLLCNCIVGAFEPDFVIPLENVTVAQGRDATFTCVVNNLGGHRVSGDGASVPAKVAWIKADAKAILAIHEHVITNNDRLSVTHNDYNTWTLNIRSVKMEDAGKYMCQVNTDPMKMQTAILEVVIPPDIINEETSGDMMVPEGGSAKLVCRARGHPKPKITWRREDGREIIARNGVHQKTKAMAVEGEMLTLSKVTRSEMGAYMCIASNGVPPTVSKRMKLQVHFHPLVQVPNQLVGAPVLTDVTLICNVEASPKAINYWQRENGEMIIAGDRYALTEKENNMYAVEMILHIRRLQTSDFGGYKCISKNSIGDTEGTIRLYAMEPTGKKNQRDDDINEVTKNEIVLKENRHEDGSRNQNGRLYKERSNEAELGSGGIACGPLKAGGIRQMKTFILPLLVLLTTATITTAATRTTTTARRTSARTMRCHTTNNNGGSNNGGHSTTTATRTRTTRHRQTMAGLSVVGFQRWVGSASSSVALRSRTTTATTTQHGSSNNNNNHNNSDRLLL